MFCRSILGALIVLTSCTEKASDNGCFINESSRELISAVPIDNEEVYVIHYVVGGCSICMIELQAWKKLLAGETPEVEGVPVYFIVNGQTPEDANYTFEKADFRYPLIYDSAYVFQDSNGISQKRTKQTLIVKGNRIVWEGNHERLACALEKIKSSI